MRQASAPHSETSDLLDRVGVFLDRFVVLPGESARIAVVLFVMHTWALEAATTTPYLVVASPERRSGKTRLLEVLALLVREPWHCASASPAAIFRKIEAVEPTLLLDETDAIFGAHTERTEPLRALLNAGNRRGASVTRIVGSKHEVADFSSFCAKVLAGIDTGRLPETIEDRAVILRMQRRRPNERVERLRSRLVGPQATALTNDLEGWATVAIPCLSDALPELPDELGDRAADAWEPLLAIADLAGGAWPVHARSAAVALSAATDGNEVGHGTQLLGALRHAMRGIDVSATADLLKAINADERLPFGGWRDGKGIDARTLARLLRPYGVRPRTVRTGETTAKGYHAHDLADAWARYLSPSQASQASPAHQRPPRGSHEHSDVTDVTDVTNGGEAASRTGDVCAYRGHGEHWRPHPNTGRIVCWRCHPPAAVYANGTGS